MRHAILRATSIAGGRLPTACLCLLLCVGLGRAQAGRGKSGGQEARPNLSGTWVLDETIQGSLKTKHPVLEVGQVTLVISHREPEVRMTKATSSKEGERAREFIFYTDGRGETNQGPALGLSPNDAGGKIKSVTEWKKDRLVTTSRTRRALRGAFYGVDIFDEWRLSSDGLALTQTTRVNAEKTRLGSPVYIIPGGAGIKSVYRCLSD